ncbi:hypothetical protein CMK20_11610 [Candidatus Poribacteria bacterium]|nr:hypothetical protein [Candidatus Poribacteria bacterium]
MKIHKIFFTQHTTMENTNFLNTIMLDKTRAKIGLISRLFNKLELPIKKQINRVRNLRLKRAEGDLDNV